jgi:hypothetical protein
MVPQLRLTQRQSDDLHAICRLTPQQIRLVVQALAELEPIPLHSQKVFASVKTALGEQPDVADALCRQALSPRGLIRQWDLTTDDAVRGITAGIEKHKDWEPENVDKWKQLEPEFRILLESRAIQLTASAIDLSYEYANLYRRGRIITDVRPLFSSDANAIEGAVVSYTLRLRFDNIEGEHDFSIAMDQQDIDQLMEQCERAKAKASTAKNLMTAHVPTIITGEREDA